MSKVIDGFQNTLLGIFAQTCGFQVVSSTGEVSGLPLSMGELQTRLEAEPNAKLTYQYDDFELSLEDLYHGLSFYWDTPAYSAPTFDGQRKWWLKLAIEDLSHLPAGERMRTFETVEHLESLAEKNVRKYPQETLEFLSSVNLQSSLDKRVQPERYPSRPQEFKGIIITLPLKEKPSNFTHTTLTAFLLAKKLDSKLSSFWVFSSDDVPTEIFDGSLALLVPSEDPVASMQLAEMLLVAELNKRRQEVDAFEEVDYFAQMEEVLLLVGKSLQALG